MWLNVGDRSLLQKTMKLDGFFEACAWSDDENERVLNKTAKNLHKDLLVKDILSLNLWSS